MRAARLGDRRVFLAVCLADVLVCHALAALGMSQGIWLLNLPATISFGRVASMMGGNAVGLAVTVPAGAAIYGWAGACLYRGDSARGTGPG